MGDIESILGKGLSGILWNLLAGEDMDERSLALARGIDAELHALLRMGWDLGGDR